MARSSMEKNKARAWSGVATLAPIASMIVRACSTSCAFVAFTPLRR